MVYVACLFITAALSGCSGQSSSSGTQKAVVYSSVDEVFAEPICKQFERETGITVELVPDTEETKSTGLLNRLIAERERPRADVFWSGDPVRAAILKAETEAALARSEAAQIPLRSDVELPVGFPFLPVPQLKVMPVDYGTLAERLKDLSGGFLKQWVDENQ